MFHVYCITFQFDTGIILVLGVSRFICLVIFPISWIATLDFGFITSP